MKDEFDADELASALRSSSSDIDVTVPAARPPRDMRKAFDSESSDSIDKLLDGLNGDDELNLDEHLPPPPAPPPAPPRAQRAIRTRGKKPRGKRSRRLDGNFNAAKYLEYLRRKYMAVVNGPVENLIVLMSDDKWLVFRNLSTDQYRQLTNPQRKAFKLLYNFFRRLKYHFSYLYKINKLNAKRPMLPHPFFVPQIYLKGNSPHEPSPPRESPNKSPRESPPRESPLRESPPRESPPRESPNKSPRESPRESPKPLSPLPHDEPLPDDWLPDEPLPDDWLPDEPPPDVPHDEPPVPAERQRPRNRTRRIYQTRLRAPIGPPSSRTRSQLTPRGTHRR